MVLPNIAKSNNREGYFNWLETAAKTRRHPAITMNCDQHFLFNLGKKQKMTDKFQNRLSSSMSRRPAKISEH